MSAEAVIAEPEVQKPTPPAAHPGAVTIDLGNLSKKAAPKVEPPVVAEVTPPVVEPEKVVAETTPDPTKKPNDKEHNMAELRKAREAAEKARQEVEVERDRIKAELEALRIKAPELPEDIKTKLTAVEQLEKERAELTQRLRQADLSRDPEFQEKYNKQIVDRITTMGQTAIAAGVSEAEWKLAASEWDADKFAEWSETMTPAQRIRFTNAWMASEELHQKQQEELKNADQTYQELQKQRQAEIENQQKQYLSQNEQTARAILAEVLKPEGTKEYEDLPAAAEAIVLRAARHEIPATEIFQQLAQNQVLARVTVKQKATIDDLQAQLAERDKRLKDQEAFIAQHAGAVPRGDAAGTTAPTKDGTAIWKNLVVKTG